MERLKMFIQEEAAFETNSSERCFEKSWPLSIKVLLARIFW
jgi:hypothetical protein